jgi:hypothetical protein
MSAEKRFRRTLARLSEWEKREIGCYAGEDRLDAAIFESTDFCLGTHSRHLWMMAADGHRVEMTLRDGDKFWYEVGLSRIDAPTRRLRVTGSVHKHSSRFENAPSLADPPGPYSAQTIGMKAQKATKAARSGDWLQVLLICADMECDVKITLHNDHEHTGYHWFRTTKALVAAPKTYGWLSLVRLMFGTGGPEGVTGPCGRVRVEDAGSDYIIAPGLQVFGPNATPIGTAPTTWPTDFNTGQDYYAELIRDDDRSDLPIPPAAIPFAMPALESPMRPFGMWLHQLAQALTWTLLGTQMREDKRRGVTVRFDDMEFHSVTEAIDSFKDSAAAAEAAAALWRFAATDTKPLRREAVLGAFSHLVRPNDDVSAVRASDVEHRAKRLLHQARHGRLTEAIATLRSAQRAGFETARSIGDNTRTAAHSAVERVFVQVVVVAGIVIARFTGALEPEVAIGLLFVVLMITFGVSFIAFRYEYPAAETLHGAFIADLQIHSKDLPKGDLDEVERMEALSSAIETLDRSKRMVRFVVVVGALVCLAAIVWVSNTWKGWIGLVVSLGGAILIGTVAWISRPHIDPEFNGICPVGLAKGKRIKGKRAFTATYKRSRYALADHKAQTEFDKSPSDVVEKARAAVRKDPALIEATVSVVSE